MAKVGTNKTCRNTRSISVYWSEISTEWYRNHRKWVLITPSCTPRLIEPFQNLGQSYRKCTEKRCFFKIMKKQALQHPFFLIPSEWGMDYEYSVKFSWNWHDFYYLKCNFLVFLGPCSDSDLVLYQTYCRCEVSYYKFTVFAKDIFSRHISSLN